MATALEGSGRTSVAAHCLQFALSTSEPATATGAYASARHTAALLNAGDAAGALAGVQAALTVFPNDPALRYLFGLAKIKRWVWGWDRMRDNLRWLCVLSSGDRKNGKREISKLAKVLPAANLLLERLAAGGGGGGNAD